MANSPTSVLDAPNLTHLWTQLLVEELVRSGVETFFVAPGSRSTPLTVAVARHREAEAVLHVDERGAAFAALGVGRATGRPAAWITTSGTAVANGLPATVEASVDGVPLLLLTADRPPELRDTGANQTIDQVKIFGDYVRWQVDVPPPSEDVDPAYVLTTADQAVHRSVRVPPGPVHVNCMFRKPLEPVEQPESIAFPTAVREWAASTTPFTTYPRPTVTPNAEEIERLAEAISGTERGLIVAGRLDTDAEVDAAMKLARHLDWPLIPDVTSRLRLGRRDGVDMVTYGDLVLCSTPFQRTYDPDTVLHVGGRYASKRVRLFLREHAPRVRAVLRPNPARQDPDHRGTHHVEAALPHAVEVLTERVPEREGGGAWTRAWRTASEVAGRVLDSALGGADGVTEPAVARAVSELVPADHEIVTASSMPVRDLNRHASAEGEAAPVHANRGASGIDGTVSTAAGVSIGSDGPVTLLIGDLALWHDLNGFALLDERPVVVVALNNDGGGIFHFLPIEEHVDVFEPYFTTPQNRSFEQIAQTFDLPYSCPETMSDFRTAYRNACRAERSALIEVHTDREQNAALHGDLETAVAKAVEEVLGL